MLKIKDVSKTYLNGGVKQVSLTEDHPGCIGIFGENGAGKTTFLELISGVLYPDKGEIERQGTLGFQPQGSPPYSEVRVEDFLRFVKSFDTKNRQGLEAVIEQFELKDDLSKRLGHLSQGMMQKVMLAKAWVFDPDMVVLDEPFSGLDLRSKERLVKFIQEEKKTKLVIMASHDRYELEVLADRVIEFKEGQICRDVSWKTLRLLGQSFEEVLR